MKTKTKNIFIIFAFFIAITMSFVAMSKAFQKETLAKENTLFFNVENLGGGEKTIKWSGIDNCEYYEVYINGKQYSTNYKNNSIKYNEVVENVGENYLKIVVNGNKNLCFEKIFIRYEHLKTPILKFENNVLSWDKVPNANSYTIAINGCVIFRNYNDTSFNIEKYLVKPTNYNVKICANGKDFYLSSKIVTLTIKNDIKLKKPNNLKFYSSSDGVYLTWDKVDYATKYNILLDKQNFVVTSNRFKIPTEKLQIKDYKIEIFALAEDFINSDNNFITFKNKKILNVPIISFKNNFLEISPVENAISYTVVVNDLLIGNEITSLKIDLTKFKNEDLKIVVCANSNGNYCSSDYSKLAIKSTIYKELNNVNFNNKILTFDKVSNMSKLKLEINGKLLSYNINEKIDLSAEIVEIIKYNIKIMVETNDESIVYKPYILEYFNTIKLEKPKVNIIDKTLNFKKQFSFVSYKIYADDNLLFNNFENDFLDLTKYLIESKIYKIKIVANENGLYKMSEELIFDFDNRSQLTKPMAEFNDKILEIVSDKNCKFYQIYILTINLLKKQMKTQWI